MQMAWCPKCGLPMNADGRAGKSGKCPKCGEPFTVPMSISTFVPTQLPPVVRRASAWPGLIAIMFGTLLSVAGLIGIANALSVPPTVSVTHVDPGFNESRLVYNEGMMHERVVHLIASSTALMSGILVVGIGSIKNAIMRASSRPSD